MKKFFTLIAVALMAVGAQAQEKVLFTNGETYANGATLTSASTKLVLGNDRTTLPYDIKLSSAKAYCAGLFGQEVMVENTETGEMEPKTRIVYLVGNQNPKDGALDGDKSTGGGYKPANGNLPQSGTYYMITPSADGKICAYVIVNGGKNFYVAKASDGSCLDQKEMTFKADGEAPEEVEIGEDYTFGDKMTGTVEFDVVANETYYVFCTGSKLSFGGYIFTAGGSTPVESSKKLVDKTGYSLYQNNYVQKEDGSWGYETVKLDEPQLSDYNRYYYNANNQNSVETTSSAHYRYNYNADGTIASRESWNFSNGVFCKTQVNEYEYDADKNMTKTTTKKYDVDGNVTSTSGSLYEDYENGYYKVMKNFSADGTVTYESHYQLTFNDAKQIVSSIQLTGAEFDQPNQGTFYTYENGLLAREVMAYYTPGAEEGQEWSNVIQTTVYTYNSDNTINTSTVITDSRGIHNEVEWRYTYATLDPALIPQNLTADGTIGGNEVYLKWDAVADATGYVVMYDNLTAEVEGKTEFITPMLKDGLHYFAVQAVVGGEKKNLSDFVTASVKDEGNVPMENFQVLAAEKVEIESYGNISYYYNLTLSWDVPEGASPISDYKVYVDKGESWKPSANYTTGMPEADKKETYNDVNSWVTDRQNFYWYTFEDTEWDQDAGETKSLGKGPDCKLWICAIYATGESKPSNVVDVNIYNLANGESGITTINNDNRNGAVEIYNLSGQRVNNLIDGQVYIVKQGNTVKKMLK